MLKAKDLFYMLSKYIEPVVSLIGIYVLWLTTFYVSSHMHSYFCVPATLFGFLLTPFLVPAPHCQALRWVIYNGGSSIMSAWFIFGAWIISHLRPIQLH